MNAIIQLLAALIGSFGFAAYFNLHGKKLLWAGFGGFFGWGAYLLLEYASKDPYLSAFFATAFLTLYSEIMARILKAPVTVFLVSAAIPLIPGASLYRTMSNLMQKQMDLATEYGLYTLLFAACMSAGVTLTTMVVRFITQMQASAKKVNP